MPRTPLCEPSRHRGWYRCPGVLAVALLLSAVRPVTAQVTINLAEPFPAAANHNANPLATALSDTARPDILGYAVVKGGKTF